MKLDPDFRTDFLEDTFKHLHGPPKRRMKAQLSQLIEENSQLHGNNQEAFVYDGELFERRQMHHFGMRVNRLHRSLRPRFKEWLAEKRELSDEHHTILSYVLAAINLTPFPAGLRYVMPDSFSSIVDKYSNRLIDDEKMEVSQDELDLFVAARKREFETIRLRLTRNLIEGH